MSRVELVFHENLPGYLVFTNWHRLISVSHRHDDLEMNLIETGNVTYLIDGKRYQLSRGNCLWLFPEEEHQIIHASKDLSMLVFVFRASLLKSLVSSSWASPLLQACPQTVLCRTLPVHMMEIILSTARTIQYEEDKIEMAESGIRWLLFSTWRYFQQANDISGFSCHAAVQQAIELIGRNPMIQTSELCDTLHISRGYLSSLFHDEIGMTIPEYRNTIRIERFLSSYTRNRTILDCALASGFGSYAQFFRIFKKVTGKNPQQYMQEHYR